MSSASVLEATTTGRRVGTMEDLAAQVWLRQRIDPGIAYARRTEGTQKSLARNAALALFSTGHMRRVDGKHDKPSRLSIVTMPALDWSFERALVANREHGRGLLRPRSTFICGIERNDAIYRAALKRIPARETGLISLPPPAFASATYRTYTITRFHRASFEDFADWHRDNPQIQHDAAWLDFTGPLTVDLLSRVAAFWRLNLRWRLVVTSLKARWPEGTGEAMAKSGGLLPWLREAIPGRLLHHIEYFDRSPMLQLAFEKVRSTHAA